jgi:hypothetical protein
VEDVAWKGWHTGKMCGKRRKGTHAGKRRKRVTSLGAGLAERQGAVWAWVTASDAAKHHELGAAKRRGADGC